MACLIMCIEPKGLQQHFYEECSSLKYDITGINGFQSEPDIYTPT